jgi:ferredoxin
VHAADQEDLIPVRIDPDTCVGIGACVAAEPETFVFNDDGTSSVMPGRLLPRARAELVRDGCPSGAIEISESAQRLGSSAG